MVRSLFFYPAVSCRTFNQPPFFILEWKQSRLVLIQFNFPHVTLRSKVPSIGYACFRAKAVEAFNNRLVSWFQLISLDENRIIFTNKPVNGGQTVTWDNLFENYYSNGNFEMFCRNWDIGNPIPTNILEPKPTSLFRS